MTEDLLLAVRKCGIFIVRDGKMKRILFILLMLSPWFIATEYNALANEIGSKPIREIQTKPRQLHNY